MKNGIKYISVFEPKEKYICGLGVIDGKEYEFYTDGEHPEIWVDIHKAWVAENGEAWCGDKSKLFRSFGQCIIYINELFNVDVREIKPIGLKEAK